MSSIAEKNIIGYLFMDSSRMEESINKLHSDMFSTPIYADIYEEYENGFNENREVNPVTIQSYLVGMDKYTEEIINQTIMSCVDVDLGSSYKSCVEIVTNDYKVREYGKRITVPIPKDSNVIEATRQMISELEGIIGENQEEVRSVAEIAKIHKDDYFKQGVEKKRIYFGFKELDKMVGGVEGGDIIILAARPAVGKSAIALQIIEYNAIKGKKIGYFNLEMQEKQVYERMIAKASKIEMARIRNATRFLQDEEQKYNEGNEKLSKLENVFVRSGSATVSDIRLAVKNGHYDLVVIDYLQLLKPNKSRGANRYAEVGDISRGVKSIAMDFDVPIIALSQLNRASEARENAEPNMSELRESGDIEQDASVIIMLWNSDKDDNTKKKIKASKARQGKLGTEELTFNGSTMSFVSSTESKKDGFIQLSDDDDTPFT